MRKLAAEHTVPVRSRLRNMLDSLTSISQISNKAFIRTPIIGPVNVVSRCSQNASLSTAWCQIISTEFQDAIFLGLQHCVLLAACCLYQSHSRKHTLFCLYCLTANVFATALVLTAAGAAVFRSSAIVISSPTISAAAVVVSTIWWWWGRAAIICWSRATEGDRSEGGVQTGSELWLCIRSGLGKRGGDAESDDGNECLGE